VKVEQFQEIIKEKVFRLITDCADSGTVQKTVEILCNELSSKLEKIQKRQISRKFNEIYRRINDERRNQVL
jgi:hypothetical protein